jgi:sugar lactone lactonase YvrE
MGEVVHLTRPTVLVGADQGLRFIESPRWHQGRLWFLDIHDQAVKSVDLEGRLDTELRLPFKPNGFGFRRDGSIMVTDALSLEAYRWDGSELQPVASLKHTAIFCLSDGVVDSKDRMYVGDIGYNFWDPEAEPADSCVIARIDLDGSVTKVAGGLTFPNGMAISPDGRTLFVAETVASRVTAFDIDEEGGLTNRRVFAQLDRGVQPDGIALDAEGAIWLANPTGQPAVLRVREGGRITDRVRLHTHAYAVALGGPERRHLFISTSKSHDPTEIAQSPSATLLVMDAAVPGAGIP